MQKQKLRILKVHQKSQYQAISQFLISDGNPAVYFMYSYDKTDNADYIL